MIDRKAEKTLIDRKAEGRKTVGWIVVLSRKATYRRAAKKLIF